MRGASPVYPRVTIALFTICAVCAATAQPLQDELSIDNASSWTSIVSTLPDGSPLAFQSASVGSSISEDGDQVAAVIRKRREARMMGGGGGYNRDSPYCRGPYCRRRNPWRPGYLVTLQEKNNPRNRYNNNNNRRTNNHRTEDDELYIPKRSDSDTVYNPEPTPKPYIHIENPKPISHPKKSKGTLTRIVSRDYT